MNSVLNFDMYTRYDCLWGCIRIVRRENASARGVYLVDVLVGLDQVHAELAKWRFRGITISAHCWHHHVRR